MLDLTHFEQFLSDEIGMNKDTRKKILEFVQNNSNLPLKESTSVCFHCGVTKLPHKEDCCASYKTDDLKEAIGNHNKGEDLLEATLRHRGNLITKENKEKDETRASILEGSGALKTLDAAFEGMRNGK